MPLESLFVTVPVSRDDFTFGFDGTEPGDYRLQLPHGRAIEAPTNAITLRAKKLFLI